MHWIGSRSTSAPAGAEQPGAHWRPAAFVLPLLILAVGWRALGGAAWSGVLIAFCFCAAWGAGLGFRRQLAGLLVAGTDQNPRPRRIVGSAGLSLGMVLFLVLRLAPAWLAGP
jgi:hypothetical protein